MFDRITVQNGPRTLTATVHEHRAPTDASIHLAQEMREKVEQSLLRVVELHSNTFSCTWHVFDDPASLNKRAVIRFVLNEHPHEITLRIGDALSIREECERVRDAIAKRIAEVLTLDLMMSGRRSERLTSP